MVLVQKSPFLHLFLRQYKPGKCLLLYSSTKKRLSRPKKTRRSKSLKINIFPKGLTHGFGTKMAIFPKGLILGFGPKMAIFPTFLLGNISQKSVFYDILEQKKSLSRL